MISVKLNIFSNVLSMNQDVRVLFPDVIGEDEKLRVLWLCHGGSGDENEWMYYSTIPALPDEEHMAIVIVNANDSCFVDMAYGLPYATYIAEELPLILCRMFPHLSDRREENFISGLSNGGYGSLYIGLTFPHRYAAIGAFSAGDKADAGFVRGDGSAMTARVRMFGQEDIRETPYSVRYLAEQMTSKVSLPKPRIYHACGGDDPWLDLNLLVKQTFEELADPEYDYVYDQIDGMGHEWRFWDEEIRRFLRYLK